MFYGGDSMRFLCIVFIFFMSAKSLHAIESVQIKIIKTDVNWWVEYSNVRPVKQLAFLSSPNSSRVKRWNSADKNFAIVYENGMEFIRRIDGNEFSNATFQLTPTYTHLPKSYAPFSPFSDGDMLFHSERFFACETLCDSDSNGWPFSIEVPETEVIIVNGEYFKSKAKWIGYDDGQNIYVGNKNFKENEKFFAIIDSKLPTDIRQHLSVYLPKLIDFFEKSLPKLKTKPMLFASYSPVDKNGFDAQGGTLAGQVFMHWDGRKFSKNVSDKKTFWFFGHEIAHLFQHETPSVEPLNAWIHEGGAEILAASAMSHFTNDYDNYIKSKLTASLFNCKSQLKAAKSYSDATDQNSRVHYNCGLAIQSLINDNIEMKNSKKSIINVWDNYIRSYTNSNEVEQFIQSTKPYISEKLYLKLVGSIDRNQLNFYKFFEL